MINVAQKPALLPSQNNQMLPCKTLISHVAPPYPLTLQKVPGGA
jgi:hypothetical protein